mgnify:CR=1 FL=1
MTNQTQLLPLPTVPKEASWPTGEWSRSDLDPRVDGARLEAMLDHAFAQPAPDDLVGRDLAGLLVASPGNPSGTMLDRDRLAALPPGDKGRPG